MQGIRRSGGGRKSVSNYYPAFPVELEKLIEPVSQGILDSPLRWTCKSVSKLAEELTCAGLRVGRQTVAKQLHMLGYGLYVSRMNMGAKPHPERMSQFEYINMKCNKSLDMNIPVISIKTKRKIIHIGHTQKQSDIAYPNKDDSSKNGRYDFTRNTSYFGLFDHDIFPVVVPALSAWMKAEGRRVFWGARQLFIAIDWGGADSYRASVMKYELQDFADEFQLRLLVSHFPAGTYKWNKYQYYLLTFLSKDYTDHPMLNYETAIHLISAKKIELSEQRQLEEKRVNKLPTLSINKKDVDVFRDEFYGDWNYEIRPRS